MKQRYDIERLRENSETVSGYLLSVSEGAPAFAERKVEYELDEGIKEELKKYVDTTVVVVFSAEWCPDCHRNVPGLGLIAEATGMEVRVFGHLTRDAKSSDEIWRIPPSPVEVKEFNVRKIPMIIALNKEGEKVGEIIENPPESESLEEALLGILKDG